MNLIRKISVNIDNKNVMHYQVESKVFGGNKIVSDIIEKDEKFFDIYVKEVDTNVKTIWKSFNCNNVIHIEYDTEN